MKRVIFLLVIAISSVAFSQEAQNSSSFSNFHLDFLGGVNISNSIGTVFLVEGKSNITSNLNAKFSVGYSIVYKHEGYQVNTYQFSSFFNQFSTYSYNLDRIRYSIIPISFGLEYIFYRSKFIPYSVAEVGYNFYEHKEEISNGKVGFDGKFNSYDELPSIYKNKPFISEDTSYRIAFGLGVIYDLTSPIGLDLRYIYQFNSSLVNTNQILLGIVF